VTDLLVVASVRDGVAPAAALDLLGGARSLADASHGNVTVAALGVTAASAAQTFVERGADLVLTSTQAAFDVAPGEAGVIALEAAVKATKPDVVLFVADTYGRDWGPRLARRIDAGLITEVTGWAVEGGEIRFTRQVFGGKARAVFAEPHLGHFCSSALLIDRTSWSNRVLQLWQVYS